MILSKIIKIVVTSCHIIRLKLPNSHITCFKINDDDNSNSAGAPSPTQTPLGAQRSPEPLSSI